MITVDSDGFAKSRFKIGKKKLMPLSRPIRNLTKLKRIPHLAPGVLRQALSSLAWCRVHLIAAVIDCKTVAFVAGVGFGVADKKIYRCRGAWVAKLGKRARTSRQTSRKIKRFLFCSCLNLLAASPLSHSTRHLACMRTQAKPTEGQKRDSFSEQNNYSARASL